MSLPVGFDPEKGTFTSIKPVIELPRNANVYTSSRRRNNGVSLWSRFNNAIIQIGNWFAEHIDSVIGILCVLAFASVIIVSLIYVISVWSNDGFGWALLAAFGCYIGGYICLGIGWYVILVLSNVLMYGLRLIFWNAWTLILSLCAVGTICLYI